MTILRWEGYVQSVDKHTFSAVLVDKDGREEELWVEIERRRLDKEERPLIAQDAIFDWTMGGPTFGLHFRRQRVWTQQELDQVRVRAAKLAADLGWSAD